LVCGSTVAAPLEEGATGSFPAGAWLSSGAGVAFCGTGLGAGVGCAVCDRAVPTRPQIMKEANPEARMRFVETVLATRIVSILTKAANERVTREFEGACRLAAN
jgi:hypothetical protein